MKTYLLVCAFAVIGCGNNNKSGQDLGPGLQPDLAASDDMPAPNDMPAPSTCSIASQDCGAGMKCVPTASGQNVVGTCVSDGTVGEGQACVQVQSQTQFNDNCKAGFICDNSGTGNATTFLCRKVCTADASCTGQRCANFFGTPTFGWCVPTCTPFATTSGCPTGSDCSGNADDISTTMATENGFFFCKQTGAGAVYAGCMADNDCGAGLWCDSGATRSNACLQICDSTHACTQPPADGGINMVACRAFADQSGKGFCFPQ